jgi:hypothetical protein
MSRLPEIMMYPSRKFCHVITADANNDQIGNDAKIRSRYVYTHALERRRNGRSERSNICVVRPEDEDIAT